MTLDPNKLQEVENGILISDNDGTEGAVITGAPTSPLGLNFPVGSIYVQTTGSGPVLYFKSGAGANDWTQIGAADIGFDTTGLLADSDDLTGLTSLQTIIAALANRHHGKEFYFDSVTSFSTTSGTDQQVFSYSGVEPAGTYLAMVSFVTTNSKENTNNQVNIREDGSTAFTQDQQGLSEDSVNWFDAGFVHPGGALSFELTVRRTAGNGQAELSDIKGAFWRVM